MAMNKSKPANTAEPKAKQAKSKDRKAGRGRGKCASYALRGTRERNKQRKLRRIINGFAHPENYEVVDGNIRRKPEKQRLAA